MKEKDLTKKVLEKVANELSKVMNFENPIEVVDDMTDIDLLRSDIIEAAGELRADDEITEETKEVLIFLDIKLPWNIKKEVEKKDIKKPVKKEVEKKDIKKPTKKEVEKKDIKKPTKKEVEKKDQAKNKKDEFGFSLKSKNSIFAAAIKETPMTMAEIKKEKWNDKGGTHYSTWKALTEMGAGQKTKDGKMSIKKNWKK